MEEQALSQGQTADNSQTTTGEQTATTAAQGNKPASQKAPQPDIMTSLFSNPLFFIVIAVWLWVFWSSRKHKQKEAERKSELDSIKKGAKVITIGRLHGTVVSTTDDTITLKTDDKSNCTMTFDRAAIYKVLGRDGDKDEKKEE